MKAEELMVGDWVHYKMYLGKDGIYEKDIRINNIYGSEVNCELRGYEIISGKRSSNLYPIPLTSEILEKNGFKYTDNHTLQGSNTYLLRYEQNGFDYTITYKLDDWFAVDSYDDRMYRIFEMETGRWCVHQLQHALKLCGINKEIVL